MTLSTGGATTNAVYKGQTMYVASDIGTAAYTDDMVTWTLMNDAVQESSHLNAQHDMAFWGFEVDSDSDVWALTGSDPEEASGGGSWRVPHGALYSSDDNGNSWTEVSDSIAAHQRLPICEVDGEGVLARAGGDLLEAADYCWYDASSTENWGHLMFAANHVSGNEGVWMVDETGTSCSLFGTGGAVTVTDYSGDYLPSALAFVEDDVTNHVYSLLVGFRAATASDHGLVRCSFDAPTSGENISCSNVSDHVTCQAVEGSEGWDVRDIELDPDYVNCAFVGEAGRSKDGNDECVYGGASSVHVWQWTSGTLGTSTFTDFSGKEGTSQMPYLSTSAVDTELVGLSVSPKIGTNPRRYLYAHFPVGQGRGYAESNRPPILRTEVPSTVNHDYIDWESMEDDSASERFQVVQAGDALDNHSGASGNDDHWLDYQIGTPRWAPAFGIDAIFADNLEDDSADPDPWCSSVDSSGTDWCMFVLDGFGAWIVDGWDTVPSASSDMDSDVTWTQAFPDEFQLLVANDVGVMRTDAYSLTNDHAFMSSVLDLGAVRQEGEEPAKVDCHFAWWQGRGIAVDTYGEHVWVAMKDGTKNDPSAGKQLIFYSDDAGDTFCYEGTDPSANVDAFDGANLTCDLATDYGDPQGNVDWPACHTGENLQGYGNVFDVATFEGTKAFATFQADASASVPGGLRWTKDPSTEWMDVPLDGFSFLGSCTEDDFFSQDSRVAIHDNASHYTSDNDFHIELAVTGNYPGCGLLYATLENCSGDTGESCESGLFTVSWDQVPLFGQGGFAGDCPIDGNNIRDVEFDPITDGGNYLAIVGNLVDFNDATWPAGGGVCMVNLDGALPDGDPTDPDSYDDPNRIAIVDPNELAVSFTSIMAHPDQAWVYFLGTAMDPPTLDACESLGVTCDDPGVYVIEGDAWNTWSDPSELGSDGLPNGSILDLDYGGQADTGGAGDPDLDHEFEWLYAGTHGSGVYRWYNSSSE